MPERAETENQDPGVEHAVVRRVMKQLTRVVHNTANEHGWWHNADGSVINIEQPEVFASKIALIHSELSEALEHFREANNGFPLNMIWYDAPLEISDRSKPDGIAIELADVVIRILDVCGELGIDLGEAILAKMDYNNSRAYKHGGKSI